MTPAAGHTPTAPRRPRPEPGRAGTLVLSGGGLGGAWSVGSPSQRRDTGPQWGGAWSVGSPSQPAVCHKHLDLLGASNLQLWVAQIVIRYRAWINIKAPRDDPGAARSSR